MSQDTYYTLTQLNGSDVYTQLIEDYTKYTPEISVIPAVAHAGVKFDKAIRTNIPAAYFRGANTSLTSVASNYKKTTTEMFWLEAPIIVDEAIYKGSDNTAGDLLYIEGQGAIQAYYSASANQFYYGTAGSGGFVGLRAQLLPTGSNLTAVTASNSATSTTAYGIWAHPQGVCWALGKNAAMEVKPFQRQYITPQTSVAGQGVNGYWAYVSNVSGYVGLSVGSTFSVFGVTGITLANPLTDVLGLNVFRQVPLTRRAEFMWLMNRTAHASLQQSRNAILYQPAQARSGTPAVSPPPLELLGKPVVVTDALSDNENNN